MSFLNIKNVKKKIYQIKTSEDGNILTKITLQHVNSLKKRVNRTLTDPVNSF